MSMVLPFGTLDKNENKRISRVFGKKIMCRKDGSLLRKNPRLRNCSIELPFHVIPPPSLPHSIFSHIHIMTDRLPPFSCGHFVRCCYGNVLLAYFVERLWTSRSNNTVLYVALSRKPSHCYVGFKLRKQADHAKVTESDFSFQNNNEKPIIFLP
jgi:hypothetical protein